jgi:acyl-coenzyme A synthetase/AMP-(fatty) acid ligase
MPGGALLDEVVASHEAVAECTSFERAPGKGVLVVVLEAGVHLSTHQLLRYIIEHAPDRFLPSSIVICADPLPRHANGTIDDGALASLLDEALRST